MNRRSVFRIAPALSAALAVALPALAVARGAPSLPERSGASIGYPTVEAALKDLHSRPDVTFENQGGWTIASDRGARTLWSFPPADHPAYPAAVKREVVQESGVVSINMTVLCLGPKEACDDLVRSFVQLNDAMRKSLQPGR